MDTGLDVTLINEQTRKKIGKPTLLKTEKIAHGMTGSKLRFVGEYYTNVIFMGKTLRLKGFVMNRIQNLYSLAWIESFDLLTNQLNRSTIVSALIQTA